MIQTRTGSLEAAVKPGVEISKNIKHHLAQMDLYLDQMVTDDYNHQSIHEYREAIRRLRALIYFYKPVLRNSDFKDLDFISKRNFDHTSLIREIDVFENGYRDFMLPGVIAKLCDLKAPLLTKLKSDVQMMKTFNFAQFEVRLKPSSSHKPAYEIWEKQRHFEVIQAFINIDKVSNAENLERYIHEKRTLVKKLRYVHQILMQDDKTLTPINAVLEDFQDVARRLHDVCVNLRFIGQYALNDPGLLEKLIENHDAFLAEADLKYEEACRLLTQYMSRSEA
nr:CHAD domain-containing protein [Fusibacter paucivorans]